MMAINQTIHIPLFDGIETADDMPHTLSFGILYRAKIDSFQELPKDKQPPRDLWDKHFKLSEWFDEVFERKSNNSKKNYVEFDENEIE